jgi:type II secretory ATPase GspE/PulE/Tfp pilus assembly ATPase PilB-like protein
MSPTAIATPSRRLGEILVNAQVLDPGALAQALDRRRQSGKRLGAVLVEMGALDDHTVVAALAAQLGLPVADLRHRSSDADALGAVPESVARRLAVLPLRRTGDGLEVAVADPLDAPAMAELAHLAGDEVQLLVASAADVQEAIGRRYGQEGKVRRGPTDRRPGAAHRPRSRRSPRGISGSSGNAVFALVADAVRRGASHVHIEPSPQGSRVRCRIDGVLRPLRSPPAGEWNRVV